jgi:hypothetical protein
LEGGCHAVECANLSGEFVLQGDIVWLRLRIDGQEIFTGKSGLDLTRLDELLDAQLQVSYKKFSLISLHRRRTKIIQIELRISSATTGRRGHD